MLAVQAVALSAPCVAGQIVQLYMPTPHTVSTLFQADNPEEQKEYAQNCSALANKQGLEY